MQKIILFISLLLMLGPEGFGQVRKRAADYGIKIGVLKPGRQNAITDVEGLRVGHTTIIRDDVRTGVTAVIPHGGNIFQEKVPAAVFVGNGFGKLAGSTQVQELGNLETPVVLTNTLSVATAMDAVIEYVIKQPGNEHVQSVNALVGETNDGGLSDIRGRYVSKADVLEAIRQARPGPVAEGNVGAGTGTVCFGFKGGIGTSSRVLPREAGGYTVGVLVQSNFGGVLQIDGVPVGEELQQYFMHHQLKDSADGSCMIVVATDAPVDARNLERLAKRAFMGLARTGGIASNGSGDYVIAFSASPSMRIPASSKSKTQSLSLLHNDHMSPLFLAAIEATEEAILNSLFMAETMEGKNGRIIKALPIDEVIEIMKRHRAIR
jgi:D-aminopeptidase